MASHLNAMPPPPGMGDPLSFNALWDQPGCWGVDMFLQPESSFSFHINFVHPPEPMIGRVLTFLTSMRCRVVVVFPLRMSYAKWWSSWTSRWGPGVLTRIVVDDFIVLGVDHFPRSPHMSPPHSFRV